MQSSTLQTTNQINDQPITSVGKQVGKIGGTLFILVLPVIVIGLVISIVIWKAKKNKK